MTTSNTPPAIPYAIPVGRLPKPDGGWKPIIYLAQTDDLELVRREVTDLCEKILAAGGWIEGSRQRPTKRGRR